MKNNEVSVKDLPNIGDVLASELKNVGIVTAFDLTDIGSARAIYKIRGASGRGCTNMLYALEGAIKGIRWHGLTEKEKEVVREDFEKLVSE